MPVRRNAGRGWQRFPIALIAAMLLIVIINGALIWSALYTFPGAAGDDGFGLSNDYDRVLEVAEAEAALGWSLAMSSVEGRPIVTLRGRDGRMLAATVTALARRPLGDLHQTTLNFTPADEGHYVSDMELPRPSQWDFLLTVAAEGHLYHTTRRLILR
jgi:nitrogen fixation protein FixH